MDWTLILDSGGRVVERVLIRDTILSYPFLYLTKLKSNRQSRLP